MPTRSKREVTGEEGSILPPGQRDHSGFWFPLDCNDPRHLVSRRSRQVREEGRRASLERRPEGDRT